MNYILNYKKSPHFEERLRARHIDPFLVSLCLGKGVAMPKRSQRVEFTLSKECIMNAITQGYILAGDCLCITSLTVVTRRRMLITVFAKFGDTGIAN
jgi:hypothetical protein